jgi:hypothetical protein
MEELKADFDRYVKLCNDIDATKDCEIEQLKGTISRQEATIQLMERLLNNKEL